MTTPGCSGSSAAVARWRWPIATSDAVTPLGAAFRGLGFGVHASGALITQASPASVTRLSGGDATETTRTGFIERINIGDQDRRDRYTLFGPGTFEIGDGPGPPT